MNMLATTYIRDTWGPLKSAATWYFSATRVRAWPQDAIRRLYRALAHDGRVRELNIESSNCRPGDMLKLVPVDNIVSEPEAVSHAAAFHGRIGTLAFELELNVYVRQVPGALPHLTWVGDGTEATLMPDTPPLEADTRFNLWHSLFCPRSPHGLDNGELYRLNAPILARLLHRFEEEFGPLIEFEGAGVTQQGFMPYSPEVYG